ncbi:MAG: UBP-type zinc finger domain-containing protein [Pyrinomonadaceae bacterium]
MDHCEHLSAIVPVEPSAKGCEECLKMGEKWVHVRLCMSCGHVGCCDNSINRHATKHYQASRHPIIKSFEPDEDWAYCYVDDIFYPELPKV